MKRLFELTRKLVHFLKCDLWKVDPNPNSKLHNATVKVVRVIHLVLKGVKEDNCKLHASALTYSLLMAMVPFMVILFSIARAIGFTKVEEWLRAAVVDLPDEIKMFVDQVLVIVQGVNPAALGTAGGIIFLIIICKLLSGIEESFNQIWGVQAPRKISDKVRNYLAVLVIAPLLMLVANAGTAIILAFAGRLEWLGPIISLLFQLAPVFLMTLAFVALFMFLPNTRVEFRAAMVGGFTTAVLFTIVQALIISFSKVLFKKYTIYGSFAAIPVFLFWVRLNWTILLFGAELTFAVQNWKNYQEEVRSAHASMVSKLWVAFTVIREAIRVFQSPEASSFNVVEFARENNIPIRLMNEVIQVFSKAHLLSEVADEPGCYVLLQAPEHITAKKIYDLLLSDGSSPEDLGLAKIDVTEEVLSSVNRSLDEALDSITLRGFVDKAQ